MSNQPEGLEQSAAALVQLLSLPLFPVMLLTLCGVSWLLGFEFGISQLSLWAIIAQLVFQTAGAWALPALAGFAAFALFLLWIAFREHGAKPSGMIGGWVRSILLTAFLYWMVGYWPSDHTMFQAVAFGFVLFAVWGSVCETLLDTAKLIALNRPQPGPEVVAAQMAHGDARIADEAEAVSLLNSGK